VKIVIIGAGGHGQVVADILRAAIRAGGDIEVAGYLDDDRSKHGALLAGARVLGPFDALAGTPHDAVIVAVGDNDTRARVCQRLAAAGERFASALHPSAVISEDATVADGAMVCAGVIVNTGTRVGRHAILNTGCTIDHHTEIGDLVHIAPGVHMGGEVRIGDRALVGIGAVVMPRISIGAGCVVGAGAVVTRDVRPGLTVVGVPAAPVKRATRIGGKA
jgi:sugar O-acyltransferase (sialic acid O-acetyltransferase NeuD family)